MLMILSTYWRYRHGLIYFKMVSALVGIGCRAFARMTSDPYRQDMAARPTWYLTAFRLPGLVFEDMFADEQR